MKLSTQVWVGTEKPVPDRINPLADDLFWKPRGGLWTSTLDDEGGDWVRWLEGENYSLDDPRWGGDLWVLEPTEANLFVIGHPDGYNELAERFPHPLGTKLFSEGRIRSFEKMIYWPDVAEHFDGIHVPSPHPYRFVFGGQFEEYYAAGLFFNTCDAESTCWFRWCFEGEPKIIDLSVR